jgi:hypothetical protein
LIKVEENSMITVFVSGAPEGIRIPDRRYRKPNSYDYLGFISLLLSPIIRMFVSF